MKRPSAAPATINYGASFDVAYSGGPIAEAAPGHYMLFVLNEAPWPSARRRAP
jgi:hypothetical protein